jgi:3-hydroxyisobutyrate dehydrogenase-like beta-hydroxyacid dehydrogenase
MSISDEWESDARSNERIWETAIGVIGLGIMGSRMTRNLIRTGNSVTVFSRSPEPVKEAVRAGATAATSSEEVARYCKTIILSLPSTEAVRSVVLGERGLIRGLRLGSLIIDMGTTDPEISQEISVELKKKSCYFLDAPVSGGPEGAEKATLTVMVGGERVAFEQCLEVLRKVGKSIVYVGPSGSGQKMKLFNQALVAVYFGVTSEAYVWSKRMGLNADDIFKVISTSWGDSPVFRHFMTIVKSGNFTDGASVKLYKKDITLILASAKRNRISMPLLECTSALFTKASEAGHDRDDASVLYSVLD